MWTYKFDYKIRVYLIVKLDQQQSQQPARREQGVSVKTKTHYAPYSTRQLYHTREHAFTAQCVGLEDL